MLGQGLLLDECRPCKQDGMVQKQADLATLAVAGVYQVQEVEQLEERHVGVDIFDIGLQQGILKRRVGEAQGTLALEVRNLIGADLVGQWFDPSRQKGQRVDLIGLVQEARAAVTIELHRIPGNLAGVRVWPEARSLDYSVVSLCHWQGVSWTEKVLWSVYVCVSLAFACEDGWLDQAGWLVGVKLGGMSPSVGRWDVTGG